MDFMRVKNLRALLCAEKINSGSNPIGQGYLLSLWALCFLQVEQNFLKPNFFSTAFLFLCTQ